MEQRSVLVLGGARSGKSGYAERLASELGGMVLYVATATASDAEMADRIAHHRARRSAAWTTLEARIDLASRADGVLARQDTGSPATVLVEDLTLLLANLLDLDGSAAGQEDTERPQAAGAQSAEARAAAELEALLALNANVIMVSNEVGMGIVPAYRSGRIFRDAMGRLNQRAASLCKEVYFVVAGVPLRLK